MICTFYSYKGGVGRSMALANIAELFYREGLNVLMVDWDLEAPGLERFFPDKHEQVKRQAGLMNMLHDYKQEMASPTLPDAPDKDVLEMPFASLEPYYTDIYIPERARSERDVALPDKPRPQLSLMTAGRRDGEHFAEYAQSVLAFDWQEFYEEWAGEAFFEWFRYYLLEMADLILIDSRTGVTEMGGVCTYQLADVVVMFCAPSQQNVDGTRDMAVNFQNSELQEYRHGRPLDVIIVPARVDKGNSILADEFQQDFLNEFSKFSLPQLGDDARQFWDLNIPYASKYAFKESLAVREMGLASSEEIIPAFVRLAKTLVDLSRDNKALKKLGVGVAQRGRQGTPPEWRDAKQDVERAPYKGLAYYDESDAGVFFGREQVTAQLVSHLRRSQVLVVVGSSGSGKSSAVRAGLIPALRGKPLKDGTRPPAGSERWSVHVITPGPHPLKTMANSLTQDSDSIIATEIPIDDLVKDPESLMLFVNRYLLDQAKQKSKKGSPERLLLIVDQFEELFTLCRDEKERQLFIDNVMYACSPQTGGQMVLVIVLRADFYHLCLQYANLRQALSQHQKLIGQMNAAQLRRVIEEPARAGGFDLEDGLVETIMRDVGAAGGRLPEPGALPLLSHALLETWRRRRGSTLTLAGYRAAGGVQEAIAGTADAFYGQLNRDQQANVRQILLSLTELGEGVEDSRRRVALSELQPSGVDAQDYETVLQQLADSRLITTSEDTVEVAHEALIREWPRLRSWLDADREGLRIRQQLSEASQTWEAWGREPSFLYRGARLAQAMEWAEGSREWLSKLESEFLQASQALLEKEKIRMRVLIAALIVSTLVAMTALIFAFTRA